MAAEPDLARLTREAELQPPTEDTYALSGAMLDIYVDSMSEGAEAAYKGRYGLLSGRLALVAASPTDTSFAFFVPPDEARGHEVATALPEADVDAGQPEYLTLEDGRRLRWVRYFDGPDHEEMTAAVSRGRAGQYLDAGHTTTTEGAGGQVGRNVEIFALVDEKNEPVASLRLVHDELDGLPSYMKADSEHAISEEGRQIIAEHTQGKAVAEVADLWKLDEYPSEVALELYMRAAHTSMARNEAWIIGAVAQETRRLQKLFGPRVVHILGERIATGDPTAKRHVTLTPILIDPTTAVHDLLGWVDEASMAADEASHAPDGAAGMRMAQVDMHYREMVLWLFVDGMPDGRTDEITMRRLWRLRHKDVPLGADGDMFDSLPDSSGPAATTSHAVAGWNSETATKITEQLGMTADQGAAEFSEFNWARFEPNDDSDAIPALMRARSIILLAIAMQGTSVAEVVSALSPEQRDQYQVTETAHELPDGDYGALVIEASQAVLEQLNIAARNGVRQATLIAGVLKHCIEAIRTADHISVRPPTMVTTNVSVDRSRATLGN